MKQMEADVVVVSAGTAGLPAAVTAAEGGASVIIFEKLAHTGGTGNVGSHVIGVGSEVQSRKGITLTSGEIYQVHMDFIHWRADARLIKAFYDKSGSTIDWLEKLGVEFSDLMGVGGGAMGGVAYPVTHPVAGGSYTMMKILANRARELGVQILLKTPVKTILKEGGRIVGVIAEDNAGEEIQAKAKAVVVAAGGFGANPEMIKQYTGYDWGRDIYSFRMPGCTGDGIRMAWEVGAAASPMTMQLMFSMPFPYHGPMGTSFEFGAFSKPNLMVNILGERFVNEDMISNTRFGGNAMSLQKGRCAFMIFDEDTKKYHEEIGFDMPGGPAAREASTPKDFEAYIKETGLDFAQIHMASDKIGDIATSIKAAQDKGYQHLFMVDSLEELCAQTGIDLNGLLKTVVEYNRACEIGRDDIFDKNPEYLRPIKQPKFYAARFFPSAYGTLGGIKINYKTEVLTEDFEVIPGLYAAGTDAAAIYGDTYVPLGGNTQGFCVNSGRMAGESALEYIKTIGK